MRRMMARRLSAPATAHLVDVFDLRHSELKDQQRARNGKHRITEGFDPLQFFVRIHAAREKDVCPVAERVECTR